MKRRVHRIEYKDNAKYVQDEMNKRLTNGERIVSTYESANSLYVVTEDLGLGPRTK